MPIFSKCLTYIPPLSGLPWAILILLPDITPALNYSSNKYLAHDKVRQLDKCIAYKDVLEPELRGGSPN